MQEKKGSVPYRILKWLIWLFYPKMEVVGTENLPEEPSIVVGNHCQTNGPVFCELYFPSRRYTWCAGQMMHREEVADYAFEDFWSGKPAYSRWFYRILSHLITPFCLCLFNNARTIPVYRDNRMLTTFRETMDRLREGNHVVVFPEHNQPFNNIIYDFQDRFIDTAKLYYRKTGKELSFVPLYVSPRLKKMVLGKPIRFCAANSMEEERRRICRYLMEEITAMACALPRHRVVPYRNMPRRYYPFNTPKEAPHEKTDG